MIFIDRFVFATLISDGRQLPPLKAVSKKYISVPGVNLPSDIRSARMRRNSD